MALIKRLLIKQGRSYANGEDVRLVIWRGDELLRWKRLGGRGSNVCTIEHFKAWAQADVTEYWPEGRSHAERLLDKEVEDL